MRLNITKLRLALALMAMIVIPMDSRAQDPHATLVGYMGVTTLPRVVESLLAGGMAPDTPAAMVERGTTAAQRSLVSTLAELPAAVEREGLGAPALFVVGPTVGRADRLDWFRRRPLEKPASKVHPNAVRGLRWPRGTFLPGSLRRTFRQRSLSWKRYSPVACRPASASARRTTRTGHSREWR